MGINSYIFVNCVEIYKFKAKCSQLHVVPLRLDTVSKDFSIDNVKKTGLYGYIYDFSVDYHSINVADILDIRKYLLIKHDIK